MQSGGRMVVGGPRRGGRAGAGVGAHHGCNSCSARTSAASARTSAAAPVSHAQSRPLPASRCRRSLFLLNSLPSIRCGERPGGSGRRPTPGPLRPLRGYHCSVPFVPLTGPADVGARPLLRSRAPSAASAQGSGADDWHDRPSAAPPPVVTRPLSRAASPMPDRGHRCTRASRRVVRMVLDYRSRVG